MKGLFKWFWEKRLGDYKLVRPTGWRSCLSIGLGKGIGLVFVFGGLSRCQT